MKHMALLACLLATVLACNDERGGGWTPSVEFSEDQRELADQIISVFENDTPVIDYAYAENLDDGRGITAGRAGFTSATGDMLEVVERYTGIVPVNPLAAYLPRLRVGLSRLPGFQDMPGALYDGRVRVSGSDHPDKRYN
jgi:chitosanase